MMSFMICSPHPLLWGDNIEKNEIGGAYSAYGEGRVHGFGGEAWGKETTGETQA
jgi:hypothetical protein